MNIEILNWLGVTMGHGLGRTGRDVPIGIVIHICMETTQRDSLCSYLYVKHVMFLFLSVMFFFYEVREQVGRTGSGWVGGWHQ
jgi:hypothetical protein